VTDTMKRGRPIGGATEAPPTCQIVAGEIELGPGIDALIRREARKLSQFFDRLLDVRVVVSTPHRRLHRETVDYAVRIHVAVPREELVVKRQHDADLRTAVQAAFRAAGRVLQDYAARLRGPPPVQAKASVGRVSRLFPYEGYGFIAGEDGTDLYFHRNAVAGGRFDEIEVGDPVRYAEAEGNLGPRASRVTRAGRGRR
jgi:cold shock CspA family protein/ribosome-associated translation inhibitor RaiA